MEFGTKYLDVAEVSETFKWLISALNDDTKNLHWFSAHDTNQVGILQAILSNEQ